MVLPEFLYQMLLNYYEFVLARDIQYSTHSGTAVFSGVSVSDIIKNIMCLF